ncbi:uncharacterized protein V6R79_002612 [Siganus canaliculatus]
MATVSSLAPCAWAVTRSSSQRTAAARLWACCLRPTWKISRPRQSLFPSCLSTSKQISFTSRQDWKGKAHLHEFLNCFKTALKPLHPNLNIILQSLVTTEDSEASLKAILNNSVLTSVEQIHAHFNSIPSKKGTKILIWNIRRAKDGKPELDFETDVTDFRLPPIQIEELKKGLRSRGSLRAEQSIPEMHYSLREYLSILYLKPRTQVILRGKKNVAKLVAKRLSHTEHDVYKPHFSKEKVKVTFGLCPKNKEFYGIMMYHKNRLIKAYEKVGCQLKVSGQRAGVGVIGVIECNFLKPAHNKQDFEYTKEYRLTLGALGLKLNDYWKEVSEKKAREREFQALDRDEHEEEHDDDKTPTWLQCEECLKWRSVPANHYSTVPESWSCSQNPNPRYRSCSAPEEAEDSEEMLTPSYQKNHKKEHSKGRKQERKSVEVCDFQGRAAKHETLSRSSSKPSKPTFHSTLSRHTRTTYRFHSEENTLEPDKKITEHEGDDYSDTDTNNDAQTASTDTHQELDKKDTVSTDQTQGQLCVEKEESVQRSKDEEEHGEEGPNRDLLEGVEEEEEEEGEEEEEQEQEEEENAGPVRHKRKSESLIESMKKKACLSKEQLHETVNTPQVISCDEQANTPEAVSSEEAERDHSSQPEKPSDGKQQILKSVPRNHSVASTQTVVVSLPSQSRPPPTGPNDQDANKQKLAGLEKEVETLRRLLGLKIPKTTADDSTEKPAGLSAAPRPSREVGCQTDVAESSSCSSLVQAPGLRGLMVQTQATVLGLKEQPEQDRPRKEKTELAKSEACEDSRSSQESLRDIRNNVVVLLTALLPQLDLTGISLETTDVDSILQQIIDVNSLKL